ncbi:hypothetical protein SAZ11_17945 [Streptomyces sp. FXJ1.4098]|nr:hypothetical protein [Streptomyces sp. FXJ1.4098]
MSNESDTREYDPVPRDSEDVEREVGELSSRVLDMLQIKGKVTDLAPMAGPCEMGDESVKKYRIVDHPWSLHGVGNSVLSKGMENLADKLPGQGWKIVKHGLDASKNKNLQILAVHRKTYTQLEVTWMKGLDGHEPMISVDLYSRCFRDSPSSNDK